MGELERIEEEKKRWIPMIKIWYREEDQDIVEALKDFSRKYAGNKLISGIRLLLLLADFELHFKAINKRIDALEDFIQSSETETLDDEDGEDMPKTLGGG